MTAGIEDDYVLLEITWADPTTAPGSGNVYSVWQAKAGDASSETLLGEVTSDGSWREYYPVHSGDPALTGFAVDATYEWWITWQRA